MKHLKKLSVVLMMTTLFSLSFTSCIDDGVSDAVDQVYLAQAGFLNAKAALKLADAQKVIAEAAYENARAKVKLSEAAAIDAMTARQLILNEGLVETNAFTAQQNVMYLAEAQARLNVTLQEQLTLLAQAQSAYDVAMVNLGEAVAKAKDMLLLGYYNDYNYVVNRLNALYTDKINAESDIALKQLFLMAMNQLITLILLPIQKTVISIRPLRIYLPPFRQSFRIHFARLRYLLCAIV